MFTQGEGEELGDLAIMCLQIFPKISITLCEEENRFPFVNYQYRMEKVMQTHLLLKRVFGFYPYQIMFELHTVTALNLKINHYKMYKKHKNVTQSPKPNKNEP